MFNFTLVAKVVFASVVLVLIVHSVYAQDDLYSGNSLGGARQIQGFNLVGYKDDGEKDWDINADTANILGAEVGITNVDANSYGEQNLNLTARQGLLNRTTGSVELEDDVVITSQSGTKLTTDKLNWSRKEDLVTSDDHVQIEDAGMNIKGQGMIAHPSLNTAQLNRNVVAEFESGSNQAIDNSLTVTCDGPMEFDQVNQSAVFTENVVAIEADSGRILKADRVQLYFDPDTRKMRQMICTGNVSVEQAGNITFAESMVYKAGEQRIIMSGQPKLIMNTKEFGGGMKIFGDDGVVPE